MLLETVLISRSANTAIAAKMKQPKCGATMDDDTLRCWYHRDVHTPAGHSDSSRLIGSKNPGARPSNPIVVQKYDSAVMMKEVVNEERETSPANPCSMATSHGSRPRLTKKLTTPANNAAVNTDNEIYPCNSNASCNMRIAPGQPYPIELGVLAVASLILLDQLLLL